MFCMNVISFDMCRTFVSTSPFNSSKTRFKIYSYYSWGVPLLIVLIANVLDRIPVPVVLLDYKPEYATEICWMNNKNASALFFILPVGSLVLENFFFFVMTVYGIQKNQFNSGETYSVKTSSTGGTVKFTENKEDRKLSYNKNKIYFIIYFKLSVLMGLTWLFGFLASFLKLGFLWYPFIIFNSLQGTFIFIFFDLKWKVYYTAYEKVVGKVHPNKHQLKRRSLMKWIKKEKTSNSSQESKTENTINMSSNNRFCKKAKLMTKVLKWYKAPRVNENSNIEDIDKSLDKSISKYNAWQQLKIFQRTLTLDEDEDNRENDDESKKYNDGVANNFNDVSLIYKMPPPYKCPPPYKAKKVKQNHVIFLVLPYAVRQNSKAYNVSYGIKCYTAVIIEKHLPGG